MKNPAQTVSVTVDLTREEALALAQFVKRSRFDTYRECAVDDDETRLMLAAEGFSPR
jgi:hypothetical protein